MSTPNAPTEKWPCANPISDSFRDTHDSVSDKWESLCQFQPAIDEKISKIIFKPDIGEIICGLNKNPLKIATFKDYLWDTCWVFFHGPKYTQEHNVLTKELEYFQ